MSYGSKLASRRAETKSFIIWLNKNYETRINPHHCVPPTICKGIRTALFVSASRSKPKTIRTGHGTKNLAAFAVRGCQCNSGGEPNVSQVLIDEKHATRH